mmetsp:Transcript_30171/g.46098  ORF Transcript_30171/g.46098 Transcript_30171/m.46098 type:complete len:86 (+) Transcript_30171:1091-1348(+)
MYEATFLCLRNDETSKAPLFDDYDDLTEKQKTATGNSNILIQHLQDQFAETITGLAQPLQTYPPSGRARYADLNIDGFPDLFLTL